MLQDLPVSVLTPRDPFLPAWSWSPRAAELPARRDCDDAGGLAGVGDRAFAGAEPRREHPLRRDKVNARGILRKEK